MKTYHILLLLILATASHAADFMDPKSVSKEFNEPGHIPQGLEPSKYHPLNEVIPNELQEEIKFKKSKKKFKSMEMELLEVESIPSQIPNSAPSPEPSPALESSSFGVMNSAHAASKKKPDPVPTSAPTVKPSSNPSSIPQGVDMRAWDSYIRNQWDGTCTAHGLIAGMENLFNRQKKTVLSTRYFWSQYQQYSVEVAMRAASIYKQIDEVYWPQGKASPATSDLSSKGKYKLTSQEYLGDDMAKVVKALAQGYPVYVGMRVPQDMSACRASIRYSTGMTSGGHALAVVGYQLDKNVQGGGYLILKNSWGSDCGDKGYQYFPMALCSKDSMYCLFWSLKGVQS